jgi:hypothetical protein
VIAGRTMVGDVDADRFRTRLAADRDATISADAADVAANSAVVSAMRW